jgi:putative ATPase
MLELAAGLVEARGTELTLAIAQEVASGGRRRFDKGGDQFYDQISALHKAVRGTDPDGALYWLCADARWRLRSALCRAARGADGRGGHRARGSAGLSLTLDAWEAYDRLGSPEGELAIAEAVVYLACAPKSNAVYVAMARGRTGCGAVRHPGGAGALPQRPHAPDEGAGARAGTIAMPTTNRTPMPPGERYLPDELPDRRYYRPAPRGLESASVRRCPDCVTPKKPTRIPKYRKTMKVRRD